MGNAEYKKTLYIVFDCLLKQCGKSYDIWSIYNEKIKSSYPDYLMRNYGTNTREEAKKLHPKKFIPSTFDLSRRRFIKTFLSIFWEEMQVIYNLPITSPQHVRGVDLKKEEWLHPEDLCDQ
jgi:hypothetical protein